MAYNGINIKDLNINTPLEGASYIPELNDSDREIKRVLKNQYSIIYKSSNYTLTAQDYIVLCNGAIQITLPAPSSVAGNGYTKKYVIKNIGTANVTINGIVDGVANPIVTPKSSKYIFTDGSNWYEIKGDSGGGGSGIAIRDQFRDLIFETNSNAFNFAVDEIIMQNDSEVPYRAGHFSEYGFLSDYLDTGTVQANKWYYVWAISNGTTNTIRFSLSNITPQMPPGYTFKALFGACRTDSNAQTIPIAQRDKQVMFTPLTILSNGNANGYTYVDILWAVPPMARVIYGSGEATGSGYAVATGYVYGGLPLNGYLTRGGLVTPYRIPLRYIGSIWYSCDPGVTLSLINGGWVY